MEIRGWEAKQHEKDFALSAKKNHELERKKREENGEEQDESDSSTWQAGQN